MSVGTAAQMPPSVQPEICFSGRSNVGKSSLINKTLGRKSLARQHKARQDGNNKLFHP